MAEAPAFDPRVILLVDTYHDFHRGGKPGGRGRYDINSKIESSIKAKFGEEINAQVNAIVHRPGMSVEDSAVLHVKLLPTFSLKCKVSIKPDENLKNLVSVFQDGLGINILDTEKTTKLICDGGPSHLKKLAADILVPTNLVHVVTPATACDSALLQRGPAFGKPSIFEDGNNEIGSPLLSKAAILSGSSIYEISNVFDTNISPVAQIRVRDLPIDVKAAGPSVEVLNPAIYSGVSGTFNLARFSKEELLDIKRCGDSDQINHLVSLQNRQGLEHSRYVFVTIDKVAALIAAAIFKVPAIFQSASGPEKSFRVYDPARPVYPPAKGGNGDSGMEVDEPPGVEPGDIDMEPSDSDEDYCIEAEEYLEDVDFFHFLTVECAQRVRRIITTIVETETGRQVGKELAARCSYHVIEKYKTKVESISDKLLDEYITVHNTLYTEVGWGIPVEEKKEPVEEKKKPVWSPPPFITAKLNNAPGFDYTILRGPPFLEMLESAKNEVLTQARCKMNPDPEKSSSHFFKKLVSTPPPFGILTYGLLGDLIESYNDPYISVITRLVYADFLPKYVDVPRLSTWGTGRTIETYKLLTQNIAIALQLGKLSQESIDRSISRGGMHKTFRRKSNGVSKRSKKHTYRAVSNSHRKRRTAN